MYELKRVLAATDGTELAGRAVETAAALARRADCELHLVTVGDTSSPPISLEGKGTPSEWAATLEEHFERRAEAQAREVGAEAATIHVRRGHPAEEIVDVARRLDADLLVIGPFRGTGAARTLLGSTGDKVARLADRPILVAAEAHPGPFERVLAAIDISPQSRDVLENAARFAALDEAEFRVLYVQEPLSEAMMEVSGVTLPESERRPTPAERSPRAQFEELLEEAARSSDLELEARVRDGDAGSEIVEAAAEWAADLLVIGTHGHGFLHRMLLGSTSQYVLRHTDRSVLLVPRGEAE